MDPPTGGEPVRDAEGVLVAPLPDAEIGHLRDPFWKSESRPALGPWDSLPYHRLDGLAFERLCFHLLLADGFLPRYFGRAGQSQYGVDLVCGDGVSCTVYQCKNVGEFQRHVLEGWLSHFEHEWVERRANTVPKPERYVLFWPVDLRQREELESTKRAFAGRTDIRVEICDRNILDARRRDLPDVVADVFGDHAAECYCERKDWNQGLFRPLMPGSGDKRTVDRFLDLESRGHIVRDPKLVERFSEIVSDHRIALLIGASGTGKTTTALDLARSLDDGRWRVFVVSEWEEADEDLLVNGIKARATRPTVAVLDDIHRNLDKASRVVRRTRHVCRERPLVLVLAAQCFRSQDEDLIEPHADLIEEGLANQWVLQLAPDEHLFRLIAERVHPALVGLPKAELRRLWVLTGGDLALLQQALGLLDSPADLQTVDLDRFLDATLKRYFGRTSLEARNIEQIAALGQFEVTLPASWFPETPEPRHRDAVQRLLVEEGRPCAYRFVHRSLAELIFRALCRAHGHEDPPRTAAAHVTHYLGREQINNQDKAQALTTILGTPLRLTDAAHFRQHLFAAPAITLLFEKLTAHERVRLLSIATQLTHGSDAAGVYARALADDLFELAAEAGSTDATAATAFCSLARTLWRTDAKEAGDFEQRFGASNLLSLIRTNCTLFDLLRVLRCTSAQFGSNALGSLDDGTVSSLVANTVLSGKSIGALDRVLREVVECHPQDGRDLMRQFEGKFPPTRLLPLIRENGTMVDVLRVLDRFSSPFTSELLELLDQHTVRQLVDRTILNGKSIGTLGLQLRNLGRRDPHQLEVLELRLGSAALLNLIRKNGTLVDLLKVVQNASPTFTDTVLTDIDGDAIRELVEKTILAHQSIGTFGLCLRALTDGKSHDRRSHLELFERKLGAERLVRLIRNNGTLFEMLEVLGYCSPTFAETVISVLDEQMALYLVDSTIRGRRSIGTINYAIRRLRRGLPQGRQRLFELVGVSGWWRLVLGNGDLSDLARILDDLPDVNRRDLLQSPPESPADWTDTVSRTPFSSVCRFLRHDSPPLPFRIRTCIEVAAKVGAVEAVANSNWHGLAKGLAALEETAASESRDLLRRVAYVTGRRNGRFIRAPKSADLGADEQGSQHTGRAHLTALYDCITFSM